MFVEIIVVLVCLNWSANCQNVRKVNDFAAGYADIRSELPDQSADEHHSYWRDSEPSSVTDKTPGDPYRIKYAGGPVVVHGGSVIVRPEGPTGADNDAVPEFGAAPSRVAFPVGFSSATTQIGYPVAALFPGLLQRLFLEPTAGTAAAGPFDSYLSFCNRMAFVGRLLTGLFRPVLTAGFYMVVSHFLRRSVLPRVAHYLHMYMTMKDPVHHDRNARVFHGLTAVVADAVFDHGPCLQTIVCEAGLKVAGRPTIARRIQR